MRALVTGAGGMVGSHLVEALYRDGVDVLGTYYNPTVDVNKLNSELQLLECDVRYPANIERIVTEFMPDQIYHLAAQSYPTVSWEKPYETMDINVNGTVAIFESVKKLRMGEMNYDPVIVVACSSAEYGQALETLTDPKVKENTELKPLHPYGVSKVCQDLLAYQYYMNNQIKCIRARIFNTTGVRKVNDVVSDFTKKAIWQKKNNLTHPVLKVGNIYTRRAILDVKDLNNALRILAEKGSYGDVYNISSELVYQIKDIIELIEEELKIKFELEIDTNLLRTTDEKIIVGDVCKLKQDTGWKQMVPMRQTIREMLNYWDEN